MRASRIIWEGAGCPAPVEPDGTPVRERFDGSGPCAMCGEFGARYGYDEAFSTKFWPAENFDKLFPHRTGTAVQLCAGCVWCARTLALRCAAFFAREDGVWFVGRRFLLASLLDPPEPPFVACFPRYGADHGGESTGYLARFPGATEPEGGWKVKLQAKHVAVYATTATSRERYPLQVDDCLTVLVDVPLWRRLAEQATEAARLLRSGGVGATDVRDALCTLRPPVRAPLEVLARWPALSRPLREYRGAAFWPVLVDLLPMPELVPRAKPTKPVPAAPPPPPAPVRPAPPPATRQGQLTLF